MVLTRSRLVLGGYGFFAAILFVVFVSTSFPYADTISAVLAPMSMKVVFQRQSVKFPIGAQFENVQLISSANEQSLLSSPYVTVSPGLGWFLLGQPCLEVQSKIFGGVIDATVRERARSLLLDFDLESLNLALIGRDEPDLRMQAVRDEEGGAPYRIGIALSGLISGRGSAQLMGPDLVGDTATIVFLGRDVKAVLVNGLPPLELGVVRGKVLLEQGAATLQDVRAYGSDADLAANGKVQVKQDIAHSFIQLTLSLRPTAKGRAGFGLLLNLLPHAPSDGPYHVQGLLASPSLS
jgi:type II secretion system protein N